MTLFERIQILSKKKDKNLKDISLDLGYSKNYLYTLRTKEPSADKLLKIADYFHVSVDYLLGRTDTPSLEDKVKLPEDLDKILDNVKSFDGKPITENDKEAVRIFLEGRLSK
ncbi:helix-turn-helix transcriptional regulator [Enterococcus thailandicus]|uniref:helix-turn-helix domain-containing protein n=1 Tax=Enterococcus thailandicus TaxID=417368 RepID=UPI0022EBBD0F|nr:helix-turn-helix transcriptional regulator [Enterococcus thailandicus]MDA3974381.1 helix-turn-helix transcriptional regulator [Enterococcus thailandicus]MDA3976868.1 helix-turn-helix transcriptional regulator [Enterococcus thailandicus]MDA3981834.1 helix-turn-helix transcriptional regulator [Enterococcus thailandicus]